MHPARQNRIATRLETITDVAIIIFNKPQTDEVDFRQMQDFAGQTAEIERTLAQHEFVTEAQAVSAMNRKINDWLEAKKLLRLQQSN
jgi:hypothetical protein